MSFTIVIDGIKTATINGVADVVKQVNWTLKGEEGEQSFVLPQVTIVPDPDPSSFILLADLTPEVVNTWIEAHTSNMDAIKAHIQYVLDKQVAEASLATGQMPWAPPITPLPTI